MTDNISDYTIKRLKQMKEHKADITANEREMFKVLVELEKELITLRMIARRSKNVVSQYNHYVIMMSDDVGKLENLISEWEEK